ncbi:potassium transporter 1 isoform X2 [Cryptomeria japonica]|uniref:potassium transporter 1 isoform X2 n=1 Tax=Cryptomeria japonica TaxID=3369 RepID=UPI0027D9DF9A|nr:potassium transporter 1 isoform X2 [Cryptomeria japonica]
MDAEASGSATKRSEVSSRKNVLTLAYQSLGIVYGDLSTSPLYVYKSTFSGKLKLHENDDEILGVLSFIFWTFTLIPLFKYIFIVLTADDNGEVLSAVSGVNIKIHNLHENCIVAIACVILMGLFALQHYGTERVAFLFAPIVITWLICISGVGIYNIIHWNPKIFRAISPYYMYKLLKKTGMEGWVSLGGVVLCITGAETMFADLGHFSQLSIKMAFTGLVYPCLILAYMGEAAFLSKHKWDLQRSFYKAIPEAVFWPVFVVATLASVVASQAVISATFSIISQSSALSCFPRVKIVHTSNQIYGRIYIPEVNWILMCLCLAVTIGFRDTNKIGHACGLAVITVMFVTTCLMSLVIIIVWKKNILTALSFLIVFGSIELLYISACLYKVPEGGWVPVVLSLTFMAIMYIWHYGTLKKYEFDSQNKVSMRRILSSGPSLGMVRVPGIGLIYTDLVTGIPAIFGHFVTNLPAFHKVLVFVCIKSVQVPYVPSEERYLIGRIGPKEYRMFRCIVRYGYKEVLQDNYDFENQLIVKISEFIQMDFEENCIEYDTDTYENDMVRVVRPVESVIKMILSDQEENSILSLHKSPESLPNENALTVRKKQVKFDFRKSPKLDCTIRKELMDLIEAKEAGAAYILGHSQVKAKNSSSILKKFVIDVAYSFLRKNCRGPNVALSIPHISLIEVGMIYYI